MCRCCQSCWENFYWYCFEERFCYDETIANYNPEEDEYANRQNGKSNGNILGYFQPGENSNGIQASLTNVISEQPSKRGYTNILSYAKIHEEDYRRETQTNVPILGPEILAVFANSQIFQDHQPTKLNRISSKIITNLPPVHTAATIAIKTQQSNENLLKRLEGNLTEQSSETSLRAKAKQAEEDVDNAPSTNNINKRIIFTITSDSSPEGSQSLTSKIFDVIREEETSANVSFNDHEQREVVLRPKLIECHQNLTSTVSNKGITVEECSVPTVATTLGTPLVRKVLRSVKSVPHLRVCPVANETDIYSITGSGHTISMTPEVPSISFSNLPKNYEDTPTIEKYRASESLYSIQTANAIKASQEDYSMPRYFRRSPIISQSAELLAQANMSSSQISMQNNGNGREDSSIRRPEKEKSRRLQKLRGTLPPLLIHSVSFRKTRDESKQLN